MKRSLLAAIAMISLQLTGCAAIIGGKNQTISVNSNVEGADVSFNNQPMGKTPLIVQTKRGQEGLVLNVKKDGYEPYQIALNQKEYALLAKLRYHESVGHNNRLHHRCHVRI